MAYSSLFIKTNDLQEKGKKFVSSQGIFAPTLLRHYTYGSLQ